MYVSVGISATGLGKTHVGSVHMYGSYGCPLGVILLGWERRTLGVFICMGHLVSVGSRSTGLGKAPRWGVFMEVPVGSASSYVWCSLGVVLGGTSWECSLG